LSYQAYHQSATKTNEPELGGGFNLADHQLLACFNILYMGKRTLHAPGLTNCLVSLFIHIDTGMEI